MDTAVREKAFLLVEEKKVKTSPPTLRVLFLSLLLSLFFSYAIPYNDLYLGNTPLAGNLLPTNTVLVLLIVSGLVNPFLTRWAPRKRFGGAELATLWAFLAIPSGIAMAGFWRYILPQIANLYYRATPQNRWDSLLVPYAEPWMVVTDRLTVRGFYEGTGGAIIWDGWTQPLSFWVPTALSLLGASLFVAALVRRQWTDREHFTFPLVQLPYELSRNPRPGHFWPPLFYSKPFWLGIGASSLLHTISGLNLYFPSFPAIRRSRMLGEYVTAFPWDAISWTYINLYPSGIGLSYFLTAEIAFSLWFFFTLERFQQVLFRYQGWTALGMSATDFVQFQQLGAVIGLIAVVLCGSRRHWCAVFKETLSRAHRSLSEGEPLPYPIAFSGLLLTCLFFYFWITVRKISVVLTLSFLVLALGFYLAAGWIGSNGGMLMVQMRILPHDIIWATVGSRNFSPRDILTSFLLQKAFTYDLRETLLPTLLNAWKIGKSVGANLQWLTLWGIVLILTAIPVSLLSWMKIAYRYGAVTLESSTFHWHANVVYNQMVEARDPGLLPNRIRTAGLLTGLTVFSFCLFIRRVWVRFPIHPMGLIVCRGWAMENLWLMILIGWMVKGLILRYSGLSGYEALKPLFVGMILGDISVGGFLGAIGAVTRKSYVFFP